MKFKALLILAFVFSALPSAAAPRKPRIVVSIAPQAELVRALLKESCEISVLLPSGANHEWFEPTMSQMLSLSQAFLFIKVGHPAFALESPILEKLASMKSQVQLVDGAEGVTLDPNDIHYWTSPKRLLQSADSIAQALKRSLPEHRAQIESNALLLRAQLEQIDTNLKTLFRGLEGKTFLVFHPSWGYLATDYQLRQLAIEQEGKEPGIRRTEDLLQAAKSANIRTLFIEPGAARESVTFFAEQLGANIESLDPLAERWIENLERVANRIATSIRKSL